jgi:hypothetical protein
LGGVSGGMGLLIPLGIGVVMLFVNAFRKVAWFMIMGSSAALMAGILRSITMQFLPTTLLSLVTMTVTIGSGAGLMFKLLRFNVLNAKGQLFYELYFKESGLQGELRRFIVESQNQAAVSMEQSEFNARPI